MKSITVSRSWAAKRARKVRWWYVRRFGHPLPIDIPAVIDRGFRFIEMIAISSLTGLLLKTVGSPVALAWQVGLALAAGVYVSHPAAVWLFQHGRHPRRRIRAARAMFVIQTALFFFLLSYETIRLIETTISIDTPRAKWVHRESERVDSFRSCASAHFPADYCQREVDRRYPALPEPGR